MPPLRGEEGGTPEYKYSEEMPPCPCAGVAGMCLSLFMDQEFDQARASLPACARASSLPRLPCFARRSVLTPVHGSAHSPAAAPAIPRSLTTQGPQPCECLCGKTPNVSLFLARMHACVRAPLVRVCGVHLAPGNLLFVRACCAPLSFIAWLIFPTVF